MTGYTVHTGSTEQFSEGWDRIFSGTSRKSRTRTTKTSESESQSATKKPAKRRGKKKS